MSTQKRFANQLFTPSTVAQISSSTLPLELNCLVLEEDHSHVFSVEISASKNVAALKKAIKKEKKHTFEHVDADALVLWTVSIPADDTLEEELSKLELVDEGSLSPVNRLSKEFSGEPKEGYLHIIVKAPPTGMCPCPIFPLYRHS